MASVPAAASAYPSGDASWNPALRPHLDSIADSGDERLAQSFWQNDEPVENPEKEEVVGARKIQELHLALGSGITTSTNKIVTSPDNDGTSVAEDAPVEAETTNTGHAALAPDRAVDEPIPTSGISRDTVVSDEAQVEAEKDLASVGPGEQSQEQIVASQAYDETQTLTAEINEQTQDEVWESGLDHKESEILIAAIDETPVPDHSQYEHQGDATEADVAVDETPTTSLLHEPESELGDSLDLGQSNSDPFGGPVDNGLSSFEDITGSNQLVESKASEWDNIEGGDIFDNILGGAEPAKTGDTFGAALQESDPFAQTAEAEDTFAAALAGDITAAQHKAVSGQEIRDKQEDIEDLWAAALDDDDLLDTSGAVDPSGFFDNDDDGGFLDDGVAASSASAQQPAPMAPPKTSSYAPVTAVPQQQQNQYTPASNLPYNHLQQSFGPRPASTPSTFLPGMPNQFADLQGGQQRPTPKSSSSFVDKSKAGYSSPYDLPTEIVAPRKRAPAPVTAAVQPTAPPPRTSSMSSTNAPSLGPPGPSLNASAVLSPTTPSTQTSQQSPRKVSNDQSGFFADLPVAPKLKPRQTTYAPSSGLAAVPTAGPPQPQRAFTQPPAPPSTAPPQQTYGGLRQPERLPLYPEQGTVSVAPNSQQQPAPATTNRYSPAPASQQVPQADRFSPMPPAAPSQSRYAAAPGAPVTAAQRAQSFVPKTSSPLAYHDETEAKPRQGSLTNMSSEQDIGRVIGHRSRLSGQLEDAATIRNHPGRIMTPPQGPPKSASVQSSPRHSARYAPSAETAPARPLSPPKRPRTQSPLHTKRAPSSYAPVTDRRTSTAYMTQPVQSTQPQLALPSRRQFSSDLHFDTPQDERAADPLERWKGHPIFRWAPSGILVSSFPKQMPFYAAGHAIPVIKCAAGPVTIHDTKETYPLSDKDNRFPGPLQGKGKSKKKDVLAWMTSKIEAMDQELGQTLQDLSMPTIIKQRAEEKLVLWKAVQLFIEHDNILEGKAGVDDAIRRLLVSGDIDQLSPLVSTLDAERQSSAPEPIDPNALAEVRKLLFEGQREKAVWLATEKKLWSHAMLIASTMGPELWKQLIHEFVKSQVKGPGDGIRSLAAVYEVFAGNHEESIDELVPPFARAGLTLGNGVGAAAASIDGLEKWRETLSLILSNRSTSDGQAIAALGKLLAGYGRVEAAHTCYLFARTFVNHSGPDDPESAFVLLGANHKASSPALGSDLDSIMLTEVYEYAQSLNPAPGVSSVIPHLQAYKLIHAYGLADHGMRSEAQSYCESIYTAMKSTTRASPYYHAAFMTAVEDLNRCLSQAPQSSSSTGLFSKLSSDKVSGSMWKRFNTFVAGDDDDNASTGSGPGEHGDAAGPFGKVTGNSPAISRAASSADLYGAMSMGAAMNGAPPYAAPMSPNAIYGSPNQATVQPGLDRTVSGRYAPQPTGITSGVPAAQRTVSGSRPYEPQRTASGYVPQSAGNRAPSKAYTPYAAQPQEGRQPSYGSYAPAVKPEQPVRSSSDYNIPYAAGQDMTPMIRPPSAGLHVPPGLGSPYKPQPSPLSVESSPPSQNGYIPSITQSPEPASMPDADQGSGYGPPSASFDQPTSNSYEPPSASFEPLSASFEPPSASYEPPSSSYNPPSASFDDEPAQTLDEPASSYEPPSSYQPYAPSYDDTPADDEPRPKKKGIMDLSDDEDFPRPNPPPKAPSDAADRAAADRAADEAFRKAAEADAERDKAAKEAAAKKGWFGGWFGKKGEEGLEQQPKAVRAKLGEENSFYFDKELGKWVNKKGGKEEVKAAPTPPPPMMGPRKGTPGPSGSAPPSRVASGVGLAGPPGGPPSRPPTSVPNGTPPLGGPRMGTPGLEPPSRPSTGLSNASSIDDLLGPAGPKKGTVKGKKKGGRYVDVMAK
ncbi:putative COPII coat assembly protein sec16 [Elsinoe fawcettii]|nr:putative COPII coat assembly protein sec16 [Elsinoe fawcettii]